MTAFPSGESTRVAGYWTYLGLALFVLCMPRVASGAQEADKSPTYLIESIEIKGNDKTHESLIRRQLVVKPGQLLSIDDVRFDRSRYRLLSLGAFSEVRLRLRRGKQRGYVVLVVEVVERGTIVLTDVFLGTSEATSVWGGIGLAERNFLGRGIDLEGAFVLGADPDVDRGQVQQSYWLHVGVPRPFNWPVDLSASFLYLSGNEFFRRSGPSDSAAPENFLSVLYRRIGAALGVGFDTGRYTRAQVEYRGEAVNSDLPWGAVRTMPDGSVGPIEFDIMHGNSFLSVVSFTIERDSRSDPVVPEYGSVLTFTGDASTPVLGSNYSYVKLVGSYRQYVSVPWKHVLAFDVFAGIVFGSAPFFEKFFIGDINDLVPSRALGLNFSTLPSRNFFNTSIDEKRYEDFAARTSVEYIIPWFRGGRTFYSGDFFFNVGLIFLASIDDLRMRDNGLGQSIPIDLTFDVGLRLDTRIGVFRFSVGNALGRIPF